jgi:dihydrofolate reductase
MRKLIISMHVSLDSYVAGPFGEMDWIKLDEELFDLVGEVTEDADVALYGRKTWEMMDSYWPTAASKPKASKHDIEHSKWYSKVEKLVVSKTMAGKDKEKTKFIGHDVISKLKEIKNIKGKNIIVFGSPSVVHLLTENDLVDEYWLFINPVILGKGIQMFPNLENPTKLKLNSARSFACGVAGLHYVVTR